MRNRAYREGGKDGYHDEAGDEVHAANLPVFRGLFQRDDFASPEVGTRQIIHYRAVRTIIAMTPNNEITKRRAQRLQLLDFLVHPREMALCDRLDVGAGPLAVLVQ